MYEMECATQKNLVLCGSVTGMFHRLCMYQCKWEHEHQCILSACVRVWGGGETVSVRNEALATESRQYVTGTAVVVHAVKTYG